MLKRFVKSGVQAFIHSDTQWKMHFKKKTCGVFPARISGYSAFLVLIFILQARRVIVIIVIINNSISEYLGPIQGIAVPLRLIMLLVNEKTRLATGQLGLLRSEGREPGHGSLILA